MIDFKKDIKTYIGTLAIVASVFLSACGGGGEDDSVAGTGEEGGIIGTAKIIVKASEIKAKAKGGNSFKSSIASNGKYAFKSMSNGAYLLRTKSGSDFIYSVAHVSGSSTVTSNSHQITDLIIRNWFKKEKLDIDSEFEGSKAISKMPSVAQINNIESALEGVLSQLLKNSGITGQVNLIGNTFENKKEDKFYTFLNNNQVVINNNQVTLIFTGNNIQTVSINGISLDTDFTKDKENPSTPLKVRALPSGTHEIVVVWEPSTDDRGVAGYNIYRNGVLIDTTPYPVYADKGLSTTTDYDYTVEAIDGIGNKSAQSSTTIPTMTLSSPDTKANGLATDLTASVTNDDISLKWNLTHVEDIARFVIKRGLYGMAKLDIAYTTANTFTDFNLADGNYCYTVFTVDAAGNKSAASAEQCGLVNLGGTVPPVTISCNSYTTLDQGTIETDTTLNAGCYKANKDIYVGGGATLTISPSVRIEFATNRGIRVREDGALNAVGTAASPIIFTGQQPTAGYWTGITYYNSNNNKNELKYVTIEYGGGGYANLNIDYGSRIKISHSTIRKSLKYGILFKGNSLIIDEFSNNKITENTGAPVRISANNISKLDKQSSYAGNAANREYISIYESSDITEDQTWQRLNVPYKLDNNSLSAVLTVEPGVTLIFRQGGNFRIEGNGTLIAKGTASKRILFTGENKTSGSWHGLQFTFSGTANELDYVDVEYAGGTNGNGYGAVTLFSNPGRLKIHNTKISDSLQYGLAIESSSHNVDISNITYENNEKGSLLINPNLLGKLDKTSTYNDPIVLSNGRFDQDLTVKNLGVEYIAKSHTISSRIDVEAGTVFSFTSGGGFRIEGQGSLSAIGTSSSPIIFTGNTTNPIPGYWKGIEFFNGSLANVLDHVVVEYAGASGGNTQGLVGVFFNDSIVDVTNSVLRHSATNGLWLYDTTTGDYTGTTFEDITELDIFIDNP